MKPFILAIRPKTLIASVSPVLIGTSMAFASGSFVFWVFVFTLLTGLGIQITCNIANDLFDFIKGVDTQERKGPTRVTASGLLTIAQVKLLTFGVMGLTAIFGAFLVYRGGFIISLLIALALVLALAYTAGPFPLSYLGIAEWFVLVFFGPVATGFTYYLQTLTFEIAPFVAGLAPGLISCGILIVNNLRDLHQDREAGKKTLVVRFGRRFGNWEYSLCMTLACFIPFFVSQGHLFVLLSTICVIPALLLAKTVFQTHVPEEYNPLFGKTGSFLTLFTLSFSAGFVV